MLRFDPRSLFALSLSLLLAPPGVAQVDSAVAAEPASAPVDLTTAIAAATEDVRVYNDHVVTLASPFMEGRVPGSNGMEVAKDYVEFWLKDAGLEPAFDAVTLDAEGNPSPAQGKSWRQPFPLSGTLELISQSLAVFGGEAFVGDVDFNAMSSGKSGSAKGPLVFVGYSIENGPDDYETFDEDDDLTGKVALMLRFEPMDETGKSKWSTRAPWSGRAGFARKLRAIKDRNPAAVIIANAPGADDARTNSLVPVSGGGGGTLEVPVFSMTHEAADRLVRAADGRSLMELRELADEAGGIIPMDAIVEASAELERKPLIAENVAGILRGRGELADEYVVIGAHLDHLGMGYFGSRSGPGELHPGADDNASGSAAVIMIGDKLVEAYSELPEGAPARSVVLMLFSAEESGLNGSRYYANNPIVPADKHALMVNFDMIGRITNKRLSVSGSGTAEGFKEWLAPFFDASPLEIVQPDNMSGASDHTSFYQKDIPVLFGIIADFHGDYHTPRDVSSLINREDAVHTVELFKEIALAAATRSEPFVFTRVERQRRNRPTADAEEAPPARAPAGRAGIAVRFGIAPGGYDANESGVLVRTVTAGGSADEAGVQEGDRLIEWNGDEIADVSSWMGMLRQHKPDDKVQVTVERDGEELVLWVTLQANEASGG